MPKLTNAQAKRVHAADTSGRALIPAGEYLATLKECVVSAKKDKNGNSYWIWTFELDDGEFKGTKMRTNTGLAENQDFWMKTVFDAFEAKPNVDTDTLIGKQVTLVIDQAEIGGGPRKGQLRNDVTSLFPVGQGDGAEDDPFAEDGDGDEDEPDF